MYLPFSLWLNTCRSIGSNQCHQLIAIEMIINYKGKCVTIWVTFLFFAILSSLNLCINWHSTCYYKCHFHWNHSRRLMTHLAQSNVIIWPLVRPVERAKDGLHAFLKFFSSQFALRTRPGLGQGRTVHVHTYIWTSTHLPNWTISHRNLLCLRWPGAKLTGLSLFKFK